MAINELTSAHARHEVATAEWQDCAAREDDPATHAERTAALDAAAARLAAHLTPAERAAFVLRVGFDYPYARIAALLETSAAEPVSSSAGLGATFCAHPHGPSPAASRTATCCAN
ncbi:sigma factor-like helix-turn-helix DNA-binding protein [Microbacterium elymi]|uniref:RNA polymerase sigma factor 70 region 4 type 2 domain-containing protein n=1 Tax=Microbacterium elymi TaxID=2909587 RepID=A0ABY5NLQ0_9MICO|nr:sigma factor-like helix-turn-helix DNA-binding protein [Microbacterium elymi]UUT36039.1 hypothetical protein L2X98_23345 [Microbacterium elymi]